MAQEQFYENPEAGTRGRMTMSGTGRLVYYNGDLVPEENARISIFDSALMFGNMVFDTHQASTLRLYKSMIATR